MGYSETICDSSSSEEPDKSDKSPLVQTATRKTRGVDTPENLTPVKKRIEKKQTPVTPATNPSTDRKVRKKLETISISSSEEEKSFKSPLAYMKMADKLVDEIDRAREQERARRLKAAAEQESKRQREDSDDSESESESDTSSDSSTYSADSEDNNEFEPLRVTAFTCAQKTLMRMIKNNEDESLIMDQVKIVDQLYKMTKTEGKAEDKKTAGAQSTPSKRKHVEDEDSSVVEILSDSGVVHSTKRGRIERGDRLKAFNRPVRNDDAQSPSLYNAERLFRINRNNTHQLTDNNNFRMKQSIFNAHKRRRPSSGLDRQPNRFHSVDSSQEDIQPTIERDE